MPDPTMLQIAARMVATTRSFWTSPNKTTANACEAAPSVTMKAPVSRQPATKHTTWRPTLLAHADY